MEEFYALRRKDWKKRIIEKINLSSSFPGAMAQFIEEYLFYSKDKKELSYRQKRLNSAVEFGLKTLKKTRKEFA